MAEARTESAVPESAATEKALARDAALPLPAWAERLSDLYYSGTISAFVLHGNTQDHARIRGDGPNPYGSLLDFLAERVFGSWDLVLQYDLARGLRLYAGRDSERLRQMAGRLPDGGVPRGIGREPAVVMAWLNEFVNANIMALPEKRRSVAIVLDQASYLFPAADPARLATATASNLVTLLNWAASPQVKALNMAFIAVEERLLDLNDRVAASPHVATIEVPLPEEPDRAAFIAGLQAGQRLPRLDDRLSARTLGVLTAGLSLVDIEVLARSAGVSGEVLTARQVGELKKRLIEKKCQGLVEFIEPKWGLDAVVGHEAAKARFREDARLLAAGQLDVLPMGYLVTGAVGTGKTFLAQCVAGQMNAPCVMLKNFRSKYVGESEGNLERVLAVLRAMGPVVVVVDEADAALGDRDEGGDAGTSQRLFAMIAAQMGDTRYRGRILWMLLTARPDRLPVDLKRQGRAEVHIPLFYPISGEEIAAMFAAMARKLGIPLAAADVPRLEWGEISGADIEGILGRAWRRALLEERSLTPADLETAFRGFLPSVEGGKKAHQKVAAILECTDLDFLPDAVRAWIAEQGGREALAASFVPAA